MRRLQFTAPDPTARGSLTSLEADEYHPSLRRMSLDLHGLGARFKRNLGPAALFEEAVLRREGLVAEAGPLACRTGQHTGRSPSDKFIVSEPSSTDAIDWGAVNRPMTARHFEVLEQDFLAALRGREVFVQDCYAGADVKYRLAIRVVTDQAWHSLFARNLFITDPDPSAPSHVAQFTVVDLPELKAEPSRHGTRSDVVIAVNFARHLVLIGGTSYAGEIKKSIFTVLNFLLPQRNVLPMHCSANVGTSGEVALFFGLSGTGKTTLSSDPERQLIGDDEHGWSEEGVFNFEGGCYAKTIRLSQDAEPQIYAATRRFGTVLENVVVDEQTRRLDLDDDRYTENTRAAYPISFIDNAVFGGQGGHPSHIVMLTADAFGVLPPIARLTPDSAMYHFLSGYTAKVAGTEKGVTEPKATFSACFGAPFLPLPPARYARMLGERIAEHRSQVWLVNTGWTGGAYGTGSRIQIKHTRAMVNAAVRGQLGSIEFDHDPLFNVDVPRWCPGVPADLLRPRTTWTRCADYDAQAARLAGMFHENFKNFETSVTAAVTAAGPQVPAS